MTQKKITCIAYWDNSATTMIVIQKLIKLVKTCQYIIWKSNILITY